jgi:hypothetical protein
MAFTIILKNVILMSMLILIGHYMLGPPGSTQHLRFRSPIELNDPLPKAASISKDPPATKSKPNSKPNSKPKPKDNTNSVEKEDPCMNMYTENAANMQELYNFVFDDKEAPSQLEQMFENNIRVTQAMGTSGDTLDCVPKTKPTTDIQSYEYSPLHEGIENNQNALLDGVSSMTSSYASPDFRV